MSYTSIRYLSRPLIIGTTQRTTAGSIPFWATTKISSRYAKKHRSMAYVSCWTACFHIPVLTASISTARKRMRPKVRRTVKIRHITRGIRSSIIPTSINVGGGLSLCPRLTSRIWIGSVLSSRMRTAWCATGYERGAAVTVSTWPMNCPIMCWP